MIEQINNIFDKLLEKIHGGIYAMISMAVGVSLIFIAMSQFPGYNMIDNYVSELGAGPGLSGPLFNIGLILAGIIIVLLVAGVLTVLQYLVINFLKRREKNDKE